MTINDIMKRDLMEEERKQREREEAAEAQQAKSGTDIVRAATIAACRGLRLPRGLRLRLPHWARRSRAVCATRAAAP